MNARGHAKIMVARPRARKCYVIRAGLIMMSKFIINCILLMLFYCLILIPSIYFFIMLYATIAKYWWF